MKVNQYKIVLVVPGPQKIQFGALAHLPFAYLSLAAWLREKSSYKYEISVLDSQVQNVKESDFKNAKIIGISAMTGHQIKYGLKIASLARRVNPDAVIVWGGIHVSLLPEQSIKDPRVDTVVIGEGEQTFLEVVESVIAGDSVEGIPGTCTQRLDGEVIFGPKRDFLNLDSLPLPAYDLVDINIYKGIKHQFDYQSSRGCPFRCGFCYNTVFCGSRYRKKSAEKVVKELSYLYDQYGVVNFGFVDDEFFIEKKRTESIMDGIIASKKKFSITASCRLDIVNTFSGTLLSKMKRAGVAQIFFGAESGSEEILKYIKKDISTSQIISGAKKVAEADIRPILSFMSGFPSETMSDFMKTLDLIRELWRIHPLITINGIFPFNAYPGTDLYRNAVECGFSPPSTLEEWRGWSFKNEPDNPWLKKKKKEWMQIAFYMVRFKYYIARYEDRYRNTLRTKLLKIVLAPLIISVEIRIRNRWFGWAYEWRLFALAVRKTFGYL